MTAASIAEALGGRRSGSQYVARCPAHDDSNPSLSISEKDGRLLVKCHAGCEQTAVVFALRACGLWPDANTSGQWVDWQNGIRYHREWGTPRIEYRYTDEAGEHLYSIVRFEPKTFRQGYWQGGSWRWKKHPTQVLYRLREVLQNPIIFVVEGEKDVETLREHGFVATTNAGGAKATWLPAFSLALQGREVIVVPDDDDSGRKHARDVANNVLSHATSVRLLELEDAKDITDWFARGHSEVELIAVLEGSACV